MQRLFSRGYFLVLLLASASTAGIVVTMWVVPAGGVEPDLNQLKNLWACQGEDPKANSECIESDEPCMGKPANIQPAHYGCSSSLGFTCRCNPQHCLSFNVLAYHDGQCAFENCVHPAHWESNCEFGYVTKSEKPGSCSEPNEYVEGPCRECAYLTCMLADGYLQVDACNNQVKDSACDKGFGYVGGACKP